MVSKKVWFFLLIFGLLFSFGYKKGLAQQPPAQPENFTASEISACAVRLRWHQRDHADYFEVRVNDRENWIVLENGEHLSGSGDKSFNHIRLNPGSSFNYFLRSCKNIGQLRSLCSEPVGPARVTLRSLDNPPPVPTNLQTLRWEANGGRVVLSWTPNQERQGPNPRWIGFQVWRSDNNDYSFNSVQRFDLSSFNAASNTWSDTVSTDISHFYKIKTYQTDEYCDTNNNDQIRYSDNESSVLTIPRRPSYLRVSSTSNDQRRARFEWEDVDNETNFILQVADNVNFNNAFTTSSNANQNESGWIEFNPNQNFYLRVKACNNTDNNSGCSDFASTTYRSGFEGPTDLKLYIQSADFRANLAKVRLKWKDDVALPHQAKIYRKRADQQNFVEIATLGERRVGNLIIPPFSDYTDNNAALYQIYDYEVRFYYLNAGRESPAGEQVVRINLNLIRQLNGWAWSSNFGWLSMNSNNHQGNIPYGIYVDSDGLLSGYAWSSNAGWLSFNKADLNDCPSGTCEAKFNFQDKTFSGWAKFIGANPSESVWQGWLSLGELRNGQQQGFNNKIKNFFANLISLIFKR